jgi:glutamate decarboxylase
MEGDRLIMTAEEAVKRVDENTIGVVPTLGVTFTCQYEPVEEVSKALDKLQADTSLDVPIHVDGASGGFIAPFVDPGLVWDFRLPRVKSVNTSGHKFGLAPLGVGWVVWRDAEDLPDDLIFNVNYLGGNMPTFALNFSRPGGQIVAQYYNFLRLGREGYRKIHESGYAIAQYLADEVAKLGPFDVIYDGHGGIPALAWKLREGVDHGYTLFDVADRLRTTGWQVPAYTLPKNREDLAIQRILVRHDFSRDLADLLLHDCRQAMAHFGEHPVSKPMTEQESGTFNHN